MNENLYALFDDQLESKIQIVDVGASELVPNAPPAYDPLIQAKLAQLIAFEPNQAQYENLVSTPERRYFPYAIGDGLPHTLHVTKSEGFVSVLKPNMSLAQRIWNFQSQCEVVSEEKIETKRLDDISEIHNIDMLKIDIQGAETMVFENGKDKLSRAVCIHTEACFVDLYENQPSIAEQIIQLEAMGFMFFSFHTLNRFPYAIPRPRPIRHLLRRELNQLIDADAIFIPHHSRWQNMEKSELLKLAAILLFCYRAVSISLHLLDIIQSQGHDMEKLRLAIRNMA